jgi:hypothetical protein
MKKILKIVAIIFFIGFIVLQFFQIDKTNPPINNAETLEATTNVPENLQAIFKRSCDDCHSNKTVYPFYSYIVPMSWNIEEHIKEGRKELNFSVWNTYDAQKKGKKLEEICEEVELDLMPHNQYLWIHWDAKLNTDDKKTICDWTKVESEKLK